MLSIRDSIIKIIATGYIAIKTGKLVFIILSKPKFATPKPIKHHKKTQNLYFILSFVNMAKYSLAEVISPIVVVKQANKNALPSTTIPMLPKRCLLIFDSNKAPFLSISTNKFAEVAPTYPRAR